MGNSSTCQEPSIITGKLTPFQYSPNIEAVTRKSETLQGFESMQ